MLAGGGENVDDAGVAAAGDHHQALGGVHDQRLILGQIILHHTGGRSDLGGATPVALWILPRDGTGEEDAGQNFDEAGVLDEPSAGRLELRLDGDHLVALAAVLFGPAVENPGGNVDLRERLRIALPHLGAQGHQSADVIVVMMGEDHIANIAEVDLQLARILQHGARARAGIDQDFLAVGLHQRREAPFADAVVGEHGGEDGHFELLHLSVRRVQRLHPARQDVGSVDARRSGEVPRQVGGLEGPLILGAPAQQPSQAVAQRFRAAGLRANAVVHFGRHQRAAREDVHARCGNPAHIRRMLRARARRAACGAGTAERYRRSRATRPIADRETLCPRRPAWRLPSRRWRRIGRSLR